MGVSWNGQVSFGANTIIRKQKPTTQVFTSVWKTVLCILSQRSKKTSPLDSAHKWWGYSCWLGPPGVLNLWRKESMFLAFNWTSVYFCPLYLTYNWGNIVETSQLSFKLRSHSCLWRLMFWTFFPTHWVCIWILTVCHQFLAAKKVYYQEKVDSRKLF